MIEVPNTPNTDAKLWVVGESPGSDEEDQKTPFVGVSGQTLRQVLSRNGILESEVRFCNLYRFRPPNNKLEVVYDSPIRKLHTQELVNEILLHRPNVVAALGNYPLHALTGYHGQKGAGSGINNWRGSILELEADASVKVIPTYHPSFIVRDPTNYPIFDNDIRRIVEDSKFPELNLPKYKFYIDPKGDELDKLTEELCAAETLAIDIETSRKGLYLLCVGISDSPDRAIVIPYSATDFHSCDSIRRILESKAVKVFHNGGAFDIPVLTRFYGMSISNYGWDTLVAQHVMWTELPRGLDYLTSVYTRQPYYKKAGRASLPGDEKEWGDKVSRNDLYEYNAKDCCVTYKIYEAQKEEMVDPLWIKTFCYEMNMLEVAEGISHEGMLIDEDRRSELRHDINKKLTVRQLCLNAATGINLNVASPKQCAEYLYKSLKLPERRSRDTGNWTTDEDAIVSLLSYTKDYVSRLKSGGDANRYWSNVYLILRLILEVRGLRKLLSTYINYELSSNGMYKSTYKVAATDTGRWAADGYIDGTGGNGQTFPREPFEVEDYSNTPFAVL